MLENSAGKTRQLPTEIISKPCLVTIEFYPKIQQLSTKLDTFSKLSTFLANIDRGFAQILLLYFENAVDFQTVTTETAMDEHTLQKSAQN